MKYRFFIPILILSVKQSHIWMVTSIHTLSHTKDVTFQIVISCIQLSLLYMICITRTHAHTHTHLHCEYVCIYIYYIILYFIHISIYILYTYTFVYIMNLWFPGRCCAADLAANGAQRAGRVRNPGTLGAEHRGVSVYLSGFVWLVITYALGVSEIHDLQATSRQHFRCSIDKMGNWLWSILNV